MFCDIEQTIAAVASAPGAGARGVVRISGPDAIASLAKCFEPVDAVALAEIRSTRRVAGSLRVRGEDGNPPLCVPGALFLWPSTRSYTRQPSAEFHTLGSPPLLAAIIEELGRIGIRAAAPGEFTLRAFLAGRIDLTQAEAVLGVIDARSRGDLDAALDQLAGGLSRPLGQLREELLSVLAELEAGLDFVEEDIEFISRDALRERLGAARAVMADTLAQIVSRDVRSDLPRIAIVGPPNAGKSSLFNALVKRCGAGSSAGAIVSPEPGATRDFVVGRLVVGGAMCELIDTAGEDAFGDGELHQAAQQAMAAQRKQADVRLRCMDATTATGDEVSRLLKASREEEVIVLTKVDLADCTARLRDAVGPLAITCSSVTGVGLDDLVHRLCQRLAAVGLEGSSGLAAATAARCSGSLREAERALAAAVELACSGGEELVAAEVRAALNSLGELVGAVCTDDILDRVFSQFCIGK